MHASLEDLPVSIERPGFTGRWTEMGELHFAYQSAAAGSNLDEMLAIFDDKACPVEHWGYVFSGSMRIDFTDGRHETISAGEAFHTPPGHRPFMIEDTVLLQVSRQDQHAQLLRAVSAHRQSGEQPD